MDMTPGTRLCLVITHLPLENLESMQHGVYRRFAMLLEAVRESGMEMRIFSSGSEPGPGKSGARRRPDIEESMLRLWNIRAHVMVGTRKAPSGLPWIVHQLIGIFGYRFQPFVRNILDSESADQLLCEVGIGPSVILAHRLPIMQKLLSLVTPDKPVYFDLDDVEHIATARSLRQIESLRDRFFALLYIPALIAAERRATRLATQTFVCSDVDAGRLRRLVAGARIEIVRNAITQRVDLPAHTDAPVLLMVGIYSFQPNRDAAEYFISRIFPKIRQSVPGAEVWFAGGSPDHVRTSGMNLEGVRFLGFVPDITEVYRSARVVICPITSGSGTRVKLVEAASMAKAIVTTTIGAEGLDFAHGVHALVGDDADSFAAHCIELLGDSTLCQRLGKAARELAKERFDKERIIRRLANELSKHALSPVG
jgi:glycosyltransferase involved in cell wall biosynthesis